MWLILLFLVVFIDFLAFFVENWLIFAGSGVDY